VAWGKGGAGPVCLSHQQLPQAPPDHAQSAPAVAGAALRAGNGRHLAQQRPGARDRAAPRPPPHLAPLPAIIVGRVLLGRLPMGRGGGQLEAGEPRGRRQLQRKPCVAWGERGGGEARALPPQPALLLQRVVAGGVEGGEGGAGAQDGAPVQIAAAAQGVDQGGALGLRSVCAGCAGGCVCGGGSGRRVWAPPAASRLGGWL